MRVVAEWFPVRPVAIEAAVATGDGTEIESAASLLLAEQLGVRFVTKNRELSSRRVTVWRC